MVGILDQIFPGGTEENPQVALVAFHTLFNTIGVILILPFARPFASMLIRLIPEKGPRLTALLDNRLLPETETAMDALAETVRRIAGTCRSITGASCVTTGRRTVDRQIEEAELAMQETYQYAGQLRFTVQQSGRSGQYVTAMHALDHLDRLLARCRQTDRIEALDDDHRLRRLSGIVHDTVQSVDDGSETNSVGRLDRLRRLLRTQRRRYREYILGSVAANRLEIDEASPRLDAVRWLHRVAYHLWRIEYHLQRLDVAALETPAEVRETALEVSED